MTGRTRTMTAIWLVAQGLMGCNGSRAPSAPTETRQLAPPGAPPPTTLTTIVNGFVVDTAFRRLAGARVEVAEGPQAGLAASTDLDGHFLLTGSFDQTTSFRASKEGHLSATGTLHSSGTSGASWILFYLEVLAPPANLAGNYELAFTADSACSELPRELLARSHGATIALDPAAGLPAATNFAVSVDGSSSGIRQSFPNIGVAGTDLGFDGSRNDDGRPIFVEQLGMNTYLAYITGDGLAATSVPPGRSTIATVFDGAVEYCVLKSEMGGSYQCTPSQAVTRVRCDSHNHRVTFTRR